MYVLAQHSIKIIFIHLVIKLFIPKNTIEKIEIERFGNNFVGITILFKKYEQNELIINH